MAFVTYGVNSPETNKVISAALWHAIIPESFFHKRGLVAKEGSIFILKDDLNKEAGDRVRCTLVDIIDSPGKSGSETLQGDEDAYTTFTDDLLIDELRNAIKVPAQGTIEHQRVLIDCRETGFEALRKWFTRRLNVAMFNQLCSNNLTGLATKFSGSNAVPTPDADHVIRPNGLTTDQALQSDTTATMTLKLIDRCVTRAELFQDDYGKQLFQPVSIDGRELYVFIMHPTQEYALKDDATVAGGWTDIHLAAIQGGQMSDNPIYTGALGIYNRTILFSSPYVPKGSHSSTGAVQSNVRRAVFCGAGAGLMAFGQGYGEDTFRWNELDEDYGKLLGVAATTVWGTKRTMYNSSNYAAIIVPTYAAEATS